MFYPDNVLAFCNQIISVFREHRFFDPLVDGIHDLLENLAVGGDKECRPATVSADPSHLRGLIALQDRIFGSVLCSALPHRIICVV